MHNQYWILHTIEEREPVLHGPFGNNYVRDQKGRELRDKAGQHEGLYPLHTRILEGNVVMDADAFGPGYWE